MRFMLLLLLALSASSEAAEISNFRAGLACIGQNPHGEAGWICHNTEDILITDFGTCQYNRGEHRCTWVGFEFDYRNAIPGETLKCNVTQSQPADIGNPKERVAVGVTEQDFELPLERSAGHFFNPQYFLFTVRPPGSNVQEVVGACSSGGDEVFRFRYQLTYPSGREPEPAANNSIKGLPLRGAP